MAVTPARRATGSIRRHSCSFSSGPAVTTTRDWARRISPARWSSLRVGLTGAAIPAACAARVVAYSIEVLGALSVTASARRTPSAVSALAICVTVAARSA